MYWGALSTGISEPGRKRPGFLIRAGSEGGISFADPFEGGISFADPEEWVLQRICKTHDKSWVLQILCGEGGISFADPFWGGLQRGSYALPRRVPRRGFWCMPNLAKPKV